MHRLMAAPTGEALLTAATDFLQRHRASELLILSATRAAADDLVRLHMSEGAAGVHRMTLSQFTARITEGPRAAAGIAPLNGLGAEALAARAIHIVRHSTAGLEYFAPVATSPGFPRALARTLRDLRMASITADQVAVTGPSGRDLAALQLQYEALLAESRLADFPAMLRLCRETLNDDPQAWPPIPVLILDAPLNDQLPTALLADLCNRAPEALAVILDADTASIERYQRFLTPAPLPQARTAATTLHCLRTYLFATTPPPQAASDDTVQFFSAAGEGLEATEIARRLHALAAAGVPFDHTAILLRDPARYQPLLEEALHRAAVPCHFTHGSVRPDSAGRAFLALLYCASEDYPATRFAEYLSLGQAPTAAAETAIAAGQVFGTEEDLLPSTPTAPEQEPEPFKPAPETPAAWERLLVDAAVIGGRERWARRLKGLEEEFRLRLTALDADSADRLHLERQLETLHNLQNLALPTIDRLSSLPKSAPWRDWLNHLSDLADTTLRYPDSVQLALNELWAMGDAGPVSLDEVILVLQDRLRYLRRPPQKSRYGKVWIGTIEEARGQSFHTVFLPGLAEGLFPKKALEDPLLLDTHRRNIDPALPLREDRVTQERLRLRIAAAAASQALVLSYPRMDVGQNRPRVPSFYAVEVIRAAEGALPELKSFERRAAAEAETRLGWPFPTQTAHAIDDLEYDLAVLHRALEAPRGQAKGQGNYLFHVNTHVARSLRARYLRWEPKWTSADGLMNQAPETLAALEPYRLRARSWSASSLQTLSACPYRFVLHGIHRLRPREEMAPLQQMDPLTRGALFHEVQYRLFRRTPEWHWYATIADEVLNEVAAEYQDRLAPAIPRVWKAEIEDLRADLHGWLRRLATDAAGWRVLHSEYSFGMPFGDERDPTSTTTPARILDGILLRGSVDWIEEHVESGVLRITDHKTGRSPKDPPQHIGKGQYLQPLLYAAAIEALLARNVKLTRLYFCTQRGNYQSFPIAHEDRARNDLAHALHVIDQQIAGGALPASPADGQCNWCDYQSVCGPREAERIRRKPPLPLLNELRSMP